MPDSTNLISWIQDWYFSNCNGDWEHTYGFKIDTLDNPEWSVEVDLAETSLELKPMEDLSIERSGRDWLHCRVENYKFHGFGGPHNLMEILRIFKIWVEST